MPPRTKNTEPDATSAAEAAAAEAEGDKPIVVPFRGVDFDIERSTLASAHFLLAMAAGEDHRILFEAIGPEQAAQLLTLVKRGETMFDVTVEFFESLNKAGLGNSPASR